MDLTGGRIVKIVVVSNCQTGGVTVALRALLPDCEVVPFPYPEIANKRSDFSKTVRDADFLVSSAPEAVQTTIENDLPRKPPGIVRIPEVYFDAFHPDLVYAWINNEQTVQSPAGPYNSAIVLWAWQQELNVKQTLRLFNDDVLRNLGYGSRWTMALNRFADDLRVSGIDPIRFIQYLQRHGCFMHTVNHPKLIVLWQLARSCIDRMHLTSPYYNEPIYEILVDGLKEASVVWPIYPYVANSLGLSGSYAWKLESGRIVHLEQFIERSFQMYHEQSLDDFRCEQLKWQSYDHYLSAEVSHL